MASPLLRPVTGGGGNSSNHRRINIRVSGEAGVWLGLVEMRSAVAYQLFQSSIFVALGGRGTLPGGGGVNNTTLALFTPHIVCVYIQIFAWVAGGWWRKWVPQYVSKSGKVVKGHYRTVNAKV